MSDLRVYIIILRGKSQNREFISHNFKGEKPELRVYSHVQENKKRNHYYLFYLFIKFSCGKGLPYRTCRPMP